MAKQKPDIPADMWLHVATDALARYAVAGGTLRLDEGFDDDGEPVVVIILPLPLADARLAATFVNLFPVPDGNWPAERGDTKQS